MSRRYGRNQRRAHRQQIEHLTSLNRQLGEAANLLSAQNSRLTLALGQLQALFDELEGRLRVALGETTALTVRPLVTEGQSDPFPERWPEPREVDWGPMVEDTLTEGTVSRYRKVLSLVIKASQDPMCKGATMRLIEVNHNTGHFAYKIDDQTLFNMGPSSADLALMARGVVDQLVVSYQKQRT